MPQFLTAAVAGIGTAVGGTAGAFLIMNAGAVAAGTLLVGGLAMTNSQRRKAKRMARDQYNAAQVDRLVNVQTSVAPRELVLGRVRKGGHVFFKGSVGQFKEKYVMLIALAAHEIDAVEAIYFNDEQVALDVDGYVTSAPYLLTRRESGSAAGTVAPPEAIPGTVFVSSSDGGDFVSWQYDVSTPKARVRIYTGTASQAAAADVMADFPDLWTADHRARGVAYLHCEFWYDETAFPSGLPTVTALLRGAKIYDPRSGLTVFAENPALMQRHVLLHPQFGKRTSLTAAEDARITAAANACDTSHNYGDGAVPLYRAGIVFPFGGSARDALDDLAQAMAGSWAYAAGEFYCKAGVYTAPVMALGEQDLVRYIKDSNGASQALPVTVATHRSRNEKINIIAPRIYDAAQDYKQTALAPLKVAAYITRDGAELSEEVSMQAVSYAKQAHHIAGVMLRDARDPLTFTATFKMNTWPLELFDTVSLALPVYGWSAKVFEIRSRVYSAGQGITFTFKETAAAITQPDASFPAQGFAANTARPRPWDITPPSIISTTSGDAELLPLADGTVVPRVRLQWSPIQDESVARGGHVEIEWTDPRTVPLVWQRTSVSGADVQAYLLGVPDGQTILIKARTRSELAVSDETNQYSHFVVGKTAPPPSFDQVSVLAQPDGTRQFNFAYVPAGNKPADWEGCEIYYTTDLAATSLAAMTRLQDNQTFYTNSPVEANSPIEGNYRFAFVARDYSGNLSTPSFVNINLPKRRTGRVFDEYFEHVESWLGTLGSMVELYDTPSTTILEATDSNTWSALTTWDAWTRWNMSPASPCSYTGVARDLGTVLAGQVDAVVDADGTAVIELRTGSDGVSWGSWGSISAPFTARWIQVRVTLTATGPDPVPTLREFSYTVSADMKTEYINDLDISTLSGSYRIGVGDIRVQTANTYSVIQEMQPIIQDGTGAAWDAPVLIEKNLTLGWRWQFRKAGVLSDPPLVDFSIRGI
jgi:hypothetical protein